jgi:LIVCS family branched-chain amino acid:cation transporter
VFSAVVSNLGVDKIISIAVPILIVIYPVAIVLVLMASFKNVFTKDSTYKGAAYATLTISILTVIDSLGISINFVRTLPFANLGFNWLIPAIIGGILGTFLFKDKSIISMNKVS